MHTVHCHVWIERQKINDVLKGVFSTQGGEILSEKEHPFFKRKKVSARASSDRFFVLSCPVSP